MLRTIFRNLFEDIKVTNKFSKRYILTNPILKLIRCLLISVITIGEFQIQTLKEWMLVNGKFFQV